MTAQHIVLIKEQQRVIKQARERIAVLRAQRKRINAVARAARKVDASAYVYGSGSTVQLCMYVRDLDSFKDARLVRAMALFEQSTGIEFTKSRDSAEYSLREFTAHHDDIYVCLSAYLSDKPKGCERVQVGVERVERPVYELRCA